MAGNVWELVNDWYQFDYYSVSPSSNPTGPTTGTYVAPRGGSWLGNLSYQRTAYRSYTLERYSRDFNFGFRPAK